MIVSRLVVGPLGTNCYVVKDETTSKGFIIDPGSGCDRIIDEVEKLGVNVEYVLLTHGHFDHCLCSRDICKKFGAKLVFNKADYSLYQNGAGLARHFFKDRVDKLLEQYYIEPAMFVSEGDTLQVGNMILTFMNTPGHTMGSMFIFCEDVAFTGDTLLLGTVGRTDFEESSPFAMDETLVKIKHLQGDYKVYPGHGELTTLPKEQSTNSFLYGIK